MSSKFSLENNTCLNPHDCVWTETAACVYKGKNGEKSVQKIVKLYEYVKWKFDFAQINRQ